MVVQNIKNKGKKVGRKGKRGRKPKNNAPKKPQKGPTWKKKRTCVLHCYWFNGLQFSRNPNDKRVGLFKGKNVLILTDPSSPVADSPTCHLCSDTGCQVTLIGCENCGGIVILSLFQILSIFFDLCIRHITSYPMCVLLVTLVMQLFCRMVSWSSFWFE